MIRKLCAWIVCFTAFAVSTISAVDGHAVSACWRYCMNNFSPCVPEVLGTNSYYWRGKIIRVDIANSAPVKCDTIFNGLGQYPTLSFDGNKVAFYRYASRIQGNNLVGPSDSSYISVMNADGTNLQDLVGLKGSLIQGFADEECSMDWPAGDWIYYYKPPMSTNEIWRVNVRNPGQNELAIKYSSTYMRRWSMSVDAKYAGGQFKGLSCGENIVTTVQFGNVNACNARPTDGTLPGCNLALSAGGGFAAYYIGGCHEDLNIATWNHSTNTLINNTKTLNNNTIKAGFRADMATCAEMIRWSANSEKWVLQGTGWNGHADNMRYGGNQLLVNWKDGVGFPVTRNPKLPLSSTSYEIAGQVYLQNDPGDFWVNGGAANLGKYEDVNGAWISVPGYVPTQTVSGLATENGSIPSIVSMNAAGGLRIKVPSDGRAMVRLIDMQGKSVLSIATVGELSIPTATLSPGLYLLSVQCAGRMSIGKVSISR